jgi:hypothetical protein
MCSSIHLSPNGHSKEGGEEEEEGTHAFKQEKGQVENKMMFM